MKSSKLQTKRVVQALALAGLVSASLPATAVTYHLRAEAVDKTMPNGAVVPMWGYALDGADCTPVAPATTCPATVPGPDLVVPAGDTTLNVVLANTLAESVSIVIPGLGLPSVDGVPALPEGAADGNGRWRVRSLVNSVPTGLSKTYTWTGVQPATYLYHSGSHPQVQVQMGLYGAVLGQSATAYDNEVKLFYSEVDEAMHAAIAGGTYGTAPTSTVDYNPTHFLVNGGAGDTPMAAGAPGERTLVRFLNAGLRTHAPTVYGQYLSLVAEDGHAAPHSTAQYSVALPAMKTVDALLTPIGTGTFAVQDRRLDPGSTARPAGAMTARLEVGLGTGPVATADSYTTLEDTALAVPAPGVLGNDTGGAGMVATLVSGTSHGTLSLLSDGSLSYTPNPGYFGSDAFTYQAVDGTKSSVATASIMVEPLNDAPVAVADGPYSGNVGTVLNVSAATGVLANDTDADGDALTAHISGTKPAGLTLGTDGGFTFSSSTTGTFNFSYVARDPLGAESAPMQVSITMAPANRAPVSRADSATTKKDIPVTINVAANDTDPDGNLDLTSVIITTPPNRGGTVVNNHDGTVTFTPKLNFLGTDSFTYTIADSLGLTSRRATVRVNVIR